MWWTNKYKKVTWCIGVVLAMSSHSSFIPGWLVLLLQVKTQHPQTSVYMGYCLCDNYTFADTHFCICTLSGTVLPQELVDSNVEQERSDLNHGCVVCATNTQVHSIRSWWNVFSFGCTIWVEEPAKLIYFWVDLWSIQHTYRRWDKSTTSMPSIVVVDGTAVISSVTKTDQMKTYQDFAFWR